MSDHKTDYDYDSDGRRGIMNSERNVGSRCREEKSMRYNIGSSRRRSPRLVDKNNSSDSDVHEIPEEIDDNGVSTDEVMATESDESVASSVKNHPRSCSSSHPFFSKTSCSGVKLGYCHSSHDPMHNGKFL